MIPHLSRRSRRAQGALVVASICAATLLGTGTKDVIATVTPPFVTPGILESFDPDRASFEIRSGDVTTSLRRIAIPVMPGEKFEFEVRESGQRRDAKNGYRATASEGVVKDDLGRLVWTAPSKPGFAEITVYRNAPADSISLLLMITVPLDRMKGTKLEGYEVGHYPDTPLRGLASYQTPKGLVRVTREDLARKVSPHFELGQFVCKQEGTYPKFLLVRPKLLQKLERILEHVNAEGIPAPTFHVMSGYRTPHYNKVIGNVKYSRHVYGDAADVFVDFAPADGVMDDVNRDGVIDMEDSRYLATLVEALTKESFFARLIGGVGVYRANQAHGPFLHVDTRGTRARW